MVQRIFDLIYLLTKANPDFVFLLRFSLFFSWIMSF